ncbi:MAG: hypothetical protein ACOCZH_00570 [Phototrophicaceae bacterium]
MTVRLPRRGSRARLAALACGIAIFAWLGPEDTHVWPVAALGTVTAALAVWLWTLGKLGGARLNGRQLALLAALLGAVTGLASSIITAGLMLLKNAYHAHAFPDYPPALMGAMIQRAPTWALAGTLAGLALALAWQALNAPEPD